MHFYIIAYFQSRVGNIGCNHVIFVKNNQTKVFFVEIAHLGDI